MDKRILVDANIYFRTDDDWLWECIIDRMLEKSFFKVHCFVKTRASDEKRFIEIYDYSYKPNDEIKSIIVEQISDKGDPRILYENLEDRVKLLLLFS
jgi:hypothetical protein